MDATGRIWDGKTTNITIIPSFHFTALSQGMWTEKNRQQISHLER